MKIRNGFVSNSSSSSFVIVGTEFDKNNDSCKSICEKYLSEDYLTDLSDFTVIKCCEKSLKSEFCPNCGKKRSEIEGTIDWISVFNEYGYNINDINIHEDENTIIIGKSINIDIEGDSVDVDTLIEELKAGKKIVNDLGIKGGKIKLHVGTTYN